MFHSRRDDDDCDLGRSLLCGCFFAFGAVLFIAGAAVGGAFLGRHYAPAGAGPAWTAGGSGIGGAAAVLAVVLAVGGRICVVQRRHHRKVAELAAYERARRLALPLGERRPREGAPPPGPEGERALLDLAAAETPPDAAGLAAV